MLAAALLALAAPVGVVSANTLFDERWSLSGDSPEPFQVVPHRPVYLLPYSYNENARDSALLPGQERVELESEEVVYQISGKAVLVPDLLGGPGDLWLGYTQKGWWQAFNGGDSFPLRETNHEPELIYTHQPASTVFGVDPQLLTVRFSHLSDGRGRYRSRSFDRLGAGLLFDDGKQAFRYRAWYPVPGGGSVDVDDIADYFGRAQFDWYRAFGAATLHVMLRNNLVLPENRSSLVAGFTFPTRSPYLHGFLEYRHGYHDGLVDYDHASNRISLGAMLVRWH